MIMSRHRTISGRLSHVSGQSNTWPEKMSGQKRTAVDGDLPRAKKAKHGATTKTVDKWITDNDKMLNTVTWLKYSKSDREHVGTLLCSICTRFNNRLRGVRNYNQAYIVGSTNLRTSSFKEHAASDIHQRAMVLFKKSQCTDVAEYAPIARMLTELDAEAEMRLKRKFELAYLKIAKSSYMYRVRNNFLVLVGQLVQAYPKLTGHFSELGGQILIL